VAPLPRTRSLGSILEMERSPHLTLLDGRRPRLRPKTAFPRCRKDERGGGGLGTYCTLESGSTPTTQRRLCRIMSEPTESEVPLCEARWRHSEKLQERLGAFSKDLALLDRPLSSCLPLPELVKVIARGMAEMERSQLPYELRQSPTQNSHQAASQHTVPSKRRGRRSRGGLSAGPSAGRRFGGSGGFGRFFSCFGGEHG
jgi:hypothetical protein